MTGPLVVRVWGHKLFRIYYRLQLKRRLSRGVAADLIRIDGPKREWLASERMCWTG